MNNVVTLLKMEFINRFGKVSLKGTGPVIKLILTSIVVSMFFYLIWKGSGYFFGMFNKAGLAYEALVIFFTGAFLFLLIINISSTIKVLYFKGDNEILMRFPVSGWEVFWAKTIFLLITQIGLTSLVSVPLLVAYGQEVAVTASFYWAMPLAIMFLVFIPFFLSNVLAIPLMHITNKVRHRYGIIILALAVVVTGIFLIYTLVFERIVIYIRDEQMFSVFEDKTIILISEAIKYMIPTKFFAGAMLGETEVT
ncbi:MAG: putative ABC transporter permease subunit, partial [Bacillota bacterium]